MVDARVQIYELLKSINDNTKMNFPKTITSVPLITYFEITNIGTDIKVKEHISYQIDVWESTFEKCIDLMQLVDEKMVELGFHRDYVSADSDIVDASGYYRKTLRYSSYIDTRYNRLITN